MKDENVIELLRNDKEYYKGIGKNYLSNSDIRNLLNNPKAFREPVEDNKALAEGRLFHQLLLEPEKAKNALIVDASTRNTNKYKDFISENNVDFALLKHEAEGMEACASAMQSNIHFYDMIYMEGNQFEVPAIGEIEGFTWKGKADIVGNDILIDLKTTSDINKFHYSARSYNYDSQAYIYQMLFGKPLVFYVVDKVTLQLGIYPASEEFILRGKQKVQDAIKVYEKYFGTEAYESIDNHFIYETLY